MEHKALVSEEQSASPWVCCHLSWCPRLCRVRVFPLWC